MSASPSPPDCEYWSDCGITGGGCCSLDYHGGKPSYGVCQICLANGKPSRGLGDTVAKLTTKLGITPCGGCKDRQQKLNEIVPYKRGGR